MPVLDGDTEETLTERIKEAERASSWSTSGAGPRWLDHLRTKGDSRVSNTSALEARKPIKRALVSVWYKDGLEELARRCDDAGVEIVSTGSTAQSWRRSGRRSTGSRS